MPLAKKQIKPRQELLQIEKRIFRQNQQIINDSVEVYDPHFEQYRNRYTRSVKEYQRRAKLSQVENDMDKSRVILVGDYHTLDQSQRSFVRVLRSFFKNKGKNVVVAMEAIQKRHQRYLNQYLLDGIDQQTFVKKIGFKKHWFFDLWNNYAVIFDFLKYHQVPVFAVEAPGYEKKSLKERDEFMADEILSLAQLHPNEKIVVLVGDLHLAPQHLPKEIEKRAKKAKIKLPITTLYQNSANIYWHLSEKEMLDHTLVVKLRERSYCRMHTPPIIVQQSYINWLYHDEGNFDWIDSKSSFVNLVERIAQVLGLKLPKDYQNVEVYTCGDLGFMKLLSRKKEFSKTELQFIRRQIENSESYFLPAQRIAYIANVSIHHAAEEASHYIKTLMSGLEFPRSHKDAFYANVLHEALGFFGSKLINSKRKCGHLADFKMEKRYLEQMDLAPKRPVEYETAVLFIKHTQMQKRKELFHTNRISNLNSELFLSLSHALGYDLGDLLYFGFMDGQIDRETVQNLFCQPFPDDGEPGEVYLDLVKRLKGIKRPAKV